MFRRRRFVAVCLTFAFLGLALLFLHATSITPRTVRVSEIGADDHGTLVRVDGHVSDVRTTDAGNAAIVLMDYSDFATVRVVARPRAIAEPDLVAPGASIRVVGAVFGSGGSLQVFSESLGSVSVLAPPSTNLLPLSFIASNAPRLEGQTVVVRGVLAEAWTVRDYRHALLRSDGAEAWAFDPEGWHGDREVITGRLVVTSRDRCELFVGPEPSALAVTVLDLASCPDHLIGQPVSVVADIAPGELLGSGIVVRDASHGGEFQMTGFVRGWDWTDSRFQFGDLVSVEGTVEYRATEALWQIVCDVTPRH